MENATKNCGEMIQKLTLQMNKVGLVERGTERLRRRGWGRSDDRETGGASQRPFLGGRTRVRIGEGRGRKGARRDGVERRQKEA
jgi:hypothetical protein